MAHGDGEPIDEGSIVRPPPATRDVAATLELATTLEQAPALDEDAMLPALRRYESAAARNHPDALRALYCIYKAGRPGVPVDDRRAHHWLKRPAEMGHPDGQYELDYDRHG